MKEQIEPQIASTVPQLKIRFNSFELGKRQPRIERIKVYNEENFNYDIVNIPLKN